MGKTYDELREKEAFIMETLKAEEDRFRETLEKGVKILEERTKTLQSGDVLAGADAFEMYDTYGFPADLTEIILKDRGISVDYEGFEVEMKKQRERAKANWVGSGDVKNNELLLQLSEPTEFDGYENITTLGSKILKIIKNNAFVERAEIGDEVEIVLDKTCFYGEAGGQAGDSGLMILVDGNQAVKMPFNIFLVKDTLKSSNGIIIHRGVVEDGVLSVGNLVNIGINEEKRSKTAANHSAAHLLHHALHSIVGNAATQKGSSVDENRLRFDVAYNGLIGKENLRKIETIVNEIILQNSRVEIETMPIEQAKDLGAMALFSEKYGDFVRVVSMGKIKKSNNYHKVEEKEEYEIRDVMESLEQINDRDKYLSVELCGGCHVKRTGDIGCFKILKEESVAAGVRRIEAITGLKVLEYGHSRDDMIENIAKSVKSEDAKILERIESLLKENKELSKKNMELEKNMLKSINFQEMNFGDVLVAMNELKGVEVGVYREVVLELLRSTYKSNSVVVSQCEDNEKTAIIIGISEDLTNKYNAVDILKALGASGGGKNTLTVGRLRNKIGIEEMKKAL
jgi:alanyl-tRNA synthetase